MVDKEKLFRRFYKQLAKAEDAGKGTYINADVVFELASFFHEQVNAARHNEETPYDTEQGSMK